MLEREISHVVASDSMGQQNPSSRIGFHHFFGHKSKLHQNKQESHGHQEKLLGGQSC
jgi:hypothetical protein